MTGTNNGYYYQMWSNGQGSACVNAGSGGNQVSTNWAASATSSPGSAGSRAATRTPGFSGRMNASGGTALAFLYGWSTSPPVEYYVIEDDSGR